MLFTTIISVLTICVYRVNQHISISLFQNVNAVPPGSTTDLGCVPWTWHIAFCLRPWLTVVVTSTITLVTVLQWTGIIVKQSLIIKGDFPRQKLNYFLLNCFRMKQLPEKNVTLLFIVNATFTCHYIYIISKTQLLWSETIHTTYNQNNITIIWPLYTQEQSKKGLANQ